MSATEKLKALDLRPEPYAGRAYKVICPRCKGHGEVGPENHDDPKSFPCGECEGSGLREPYRSYVHSLPQIVAVVEAAEDKRDEFSNIARALTALDEALS